MSVYQEFAEHIEQKRRRLALRQIWFRMVGPVSTETFFWAALALVLVALGGFVAGALISGLGHR